MKQLLSIFFGLSIATIYGNESSITTTPAEESHVYGNEVSTNKVTLSGMNSPNESGLGESRQLKQGVSKKKNKGKKNKGKKKR